MTTKVSSRRKRTLEIDEMIKLYQEGSSTTEIAKLANVSPRYVRLVLTKQNVEKRPFGDWKRQYTVNEDYFKTWSNTMAYILGFFVADGFVASNFQQIGFAQKEIELLEQIRAEIGSNHPITLNKKTGVYMLHINSMIMKKDLMEIHGINPQKSLDVEFPYVPEEYLSHFVRGYFDGDGNINYPKRSVSFVGGSLTFLESLNNILEANGFGPYLSSKGKHHRVFINGRRSIKLFANWIYTDKTLFLERKYQQFQQEALELDQLKDRKFKSTTEAARLRKNQFLNDFSDTNSIEVTCQNMNIRLATFKSWLSKDDDFKERFNSLN